MTNPIRIITNIIRHLTIRARLILGFGLVIGLFSLGGSYILVSLERIGNAQHTILDATNTVEESKENAAIAAQAGIQALKWGRPVIEEKAALMAYVISQDEDEQQALFARFSELGKQIESIGESLKLSVKDEALAKLIGDIQSLQKQIQEAAVMVIAAYDGEGEVGPDTLDALNEFNSLQARLISNIDTFERQTSARAETENSLIDSAVKDAGAKVAASIGIIDLANKGALGLMGLSIVVGLLVSITISRSIIRPLSYATRLAKRISQYNLTVENSAHQGRPASKDELGVLVTDLKDMRSSLTSLIGQIKKMSDQLGASSTELSNTAEHVNVVADEQVTLSTQAADYAANMKQAADDVVANSSEAASSADQADALVARCVSEEASKTNTAMDMVRSEMHNTRQRIDGLSESAAKIDQIVTVINDIAGQTNLLALNAAIEAARAGEQGRGFAVVADEVRSLAERTSEATATIAEMISTVQQQVKDASECMISSEESVANGVDAVNAIVMALEEIKDINGQLKNQNSMVAMGIDKQKATADGISKNLQGAREGAGRLNENAQSINTQAQSLADVVEEMDRAVARFKM